MRLIEVPAKAGYVWFRQGIWLFRRNPLAFMMLLVAYLFAWLVLSLVPVVGALLPMLFAPGISVGFMAASRNAIGGKPFYPSVLASGFREHGRRVAVDLLILGVVNSLLVVAAFALTSIADGGVVFRSAVLSVDPDQAEMLAHANEMAIAAAIFALAYMPVSVLMWFAPVLVAWHDVPPAKALFFSWIALWRNRWAFTVYALCWAAVQGLLGIFGLQIAQFAGTSLLTLMVLAPLTIATIAMIYCSFFATYRGCFDTASEANAASADLPNGN
ncbi:MAG TPA: BPSS1780 family membrane protein [Pararobbsia sp.]|nr:BPSS1780 family membrane protein [Pararobbsia sp.]